MKIDKTNQEVTMNAFELHNFVVGLPCVKDDDTGGYMTPSKVIIEPHEELSESDREKLQLRVNEVLGVLSDLDCLVHDLAEFSC